MAYIRHYGFVRHLRSTPTAHIVHLKRGRLAHEGVGVAFSFRALTAVISEVPTAENELPLVFHARTIDFQDVAVGATITYRFADPGLAARRIDFAIDTENGEWRFELPAQVALPHHRTRTAYATALRARVMVRSRAKSFLGI